jgi:hypothetical protein
MMFDRRKEVKCSALNIVCSGPGEFLDPEKSCKGSACTAKECCKSEQELSSR